MATTLAFVRPETAFDDSTTRILGLAFDAACTRLDGNLSNLVREIIAERIIEAAKRGERDQARLCSFALAAIGGGSTGGTERDNFQTRQA